MPEIKYCEHNRRSIVAHTLYGNFRTYTCALDKRRGGDMVWKFPEPCVAECTNHFRKPDGERGQSFPYNRIDFDAIPKDERAIEQEKEEKAQRKKKAEEMRNKALSLIREADKLERD